jgi:hypothetical protein
MTIPTAMQHDSIEFIIPALFLEPPKSSVDCSFRAGRRQSHLRSLLSAIAKTQGVTALRKPALLVSPFAHSSIGNSSSRFLQHCVTFPKMPPQERGQSRKTGPSSQICYFPRNQSVRQWEVSHG